MNALVGSWLVKRWAEPAADMMRHAKCRADWSNKAGTT